MRHERAMSASYRTEAYILNVKGGPQEHVESASRSEAETSATWGISYTPYAIRLVPLRRRISSRPWISFRIFKVLFVGITLYAIRMHNPST